MVTIKATARFAPEQTTIAGKPLDEAAVSPCTKRWGRLEALPIRNTRANGIDGKE